MVVLFILLIIVGRSYF
ncbi:YjcZ family sporulation protein [Sporosarcina newyorkensis]|nr:YjcZ family sporulation protein [Sporosarcina newyorkensis]